MSPRELLERGTAMLGMPASASACDRLLDYVELLAKWNQTYNLTAIRDPRDMVSHHLLDSLAVRPHLPEGALADVGSGPGLPGIPLAIVEPERRVTLNDASQKKTAFLRQAIIELRLSNAVVHEGRVQSWQPAPRFACVITRGFSELARFIAACRHLVASGGVLAAMKGTFPRQEVDGLHGDADCGDIRRLTVPFLDAERHLVLCRCTA